MGINDDFIFNQRPQFNYLSEDQKIRIHEASLELLERVGAEYHHPEAVELLEAAGARVLDEKRVQLPSWLVEQALASAPKRVVLANRKGKRVMPLWGDNVHYGPGSETPFTRDVYTGQRREAVLQDVVNAARVVDALENIDFCMSFALATDVPKKYEDVHHLATMVKNTTKPLLLTSWDLDGIKAIYDICCAAAGGRDAFTANPFILHYVEPISPFINPPESMEKLIFSARNGIPVMYVPAPSAGGTAPATMAGAFALSNAENLLGLVLSQAVKKGAHFVYGGGAGLLDPRTGLFPYGAPEVWMSRVIRTEMAHFYGFPAFSTAGCTDSKVLDQQAAFEAGTSLMLSTLAGANIMHDVGYMEAGFTSSLDLLTMANEMIGPVRRVMRNITVSPEHLAVDLIEEIGPGGNFLANAHTAKHFRSEMFLSQMFDRNNHASWQAAGSKTLLDRCNEKVKGILETHQPEPLPDSVVAEIDAITTDLDARRQKKLVN